MMDRNRDINLAMNVPCIVLAINYRLMRETRSKYRRALELTGRV